MGKDGEGGRFDLPNLPRPSPSFPVLLAGDAALDLQGLLAGGCVSKFSTPRGCSSAGRAPGSHPGGQGFEPPQLHSSVPLGVTGNTPDSGSGESWFDPRRGNLKGRRQKRRRPFRSAPPAHYLLTSSKYNPFKTPSSMKSEMPSLSSSVSAAFLMPSLSWSSSWSSRMPSLSSSLSEHASSRQKMSKSRTPRFGESPLTSSSSHSSGDGGCVTSRANRGVRDFDHDGLDD